jgi:excinuclease ABC subunit B
VTKAINDMLVRQNEDRHDAEIVALSVLQKKTNLFDVKQRKKLLKALEKEMADHAERLEYEEAAAIRDEIKRIKEQYGN